VSDPKKLEAAQLQTAWGQFLQLPEMQQVSRQWKQEFAPTLNFVDQLLKRQIGVMLTDVLTLLEGELAVAFTGIDPEPTLVFSCHYGTRRALLEGVLNRFLGKAQVQELAGESVSFYPPSFFCAFTPERLFFSNTAQGLQFVLEQRKNPIAKTLKDHPVYQKHRGEAQGLYFYVHTTPLLMFVPPEAQPYLEQLGLFNLDGFSLSSNYQGVHDVLRMRISFKETPSGLFSPSRQGFTAEDLKPVKGHLLNVGACSFDLVSWLNLLKDFLPLLPPEASNAYEEVNALVTETAGLSLEELFNLFGSSWVAWTFQHEGNPKYLMSVELKDPQTFKKVLIEQIEKAQGLRLLSQEYHGKTIYHLTPQLKSHEDPLVMAFQAFSYLGTPTCFLLEGKHLIFSILPHTLKLYLDLPASFSGEGPFKNLASVLEGKQLSYIAYDPQGTASSYRNVIHFLKRLETPLRTFGIPADFGSFPRAQEVLPLAPESRIESYYTSNTFNLDFCLGFPLALDGTTSVLVVTAGVGVGAAILLPAIAQVKERANQSKCRSQLRMIKSALLMYDTDFGKFPPSGSENLIIYLDGDPSNGGPKKTTYLKIPDEGLVDPWGNPFHYQIEAPTENASSSWGFYVWSNGKNGYDEQGEGDDLSSWNY
jgi:general secretion pathway protein G